ncbi:EAL domain-containing protein [Pseudoalteromonas sp. T1lg23B]|uniref:EAL domain-containing protein n=1 Tax=Pseudoalteromonas sp. T1lg23B TaxID=2077097 RepID=UPI000CF62AB0|nr:EAL domain-containing protein [Pseudoalteromonas sp. T1lg23B]
MKWKAKKKLWYSILAGSIILVVLNTLLLHLLHLKIHQRAQTVVERVALLPIELQTTETISDIAHRYGLEYVPQGSQVPHGASEFTAQGASLTLYHQQPYQKHAYIISFFNILFIGLLVFFYRWWQVYQVRPKRFLTTNDSVEIPANSALSAVDPRVADQSLFSVFLLIRWSITLDETLDVKNHFSIAIHKKLPNSLTCSVKYLNSGALAVTLDRVAWGDVVETGKKLHELMFRVLRTLRADLSRKQVKVGGCFYQRDADQADVYQLARAALEIANNNVWQHVHMMPLEETHASAMQNSEEDFIRCITNGQFVLFFQPLFGFKQQDIMQNEVLLRVRHAQLGLIAAKQFIPQLHAKENLETLDKAIIEQTITLLTKESHKSNVSINIHIANWLDVEFINWLVTQMRQATKINKLLFEIPADDYYKYNQQISAQQLFFTGVSAGIIIDHVTTPLMVNTLRENQLIEGVKLGFELVHQVQQSAQQQKIIKQIIYQAKRLNISVYAVGVETQAELECLKSLGVHGAQGYYFAELLQQLELVKY